MGDAAEYEYLYGWGRTKHIPDLKNLKGPTGPGLCGAYGGNSLRRPHLPVCKRCLKLAEDRGLKPPYNPDDEAAQWSTNDLFDAFHAAGFPDHDAAVVLALMVEAREPTRMSDPSCPRCEAAD